MRTTVLDDVTVVPAPLKRLRISMTHLGRRQYNTCINVAMATGGEKEERIRARNCVLKFK